MLSTHLAPMPSVEESEVSSSPSTPDLLNEDEGDFFPVQVNDESPLSSREGSSQPVAEKSEPVDFLPSELLIAILAKLSSSQDLLNCMLVSKAWANCAVELLWHRPLFTSQDRLENIALSINAPDSRWRYPEMIRRLNLSNLPEKINDSTLTTGFALCRRIERLTLTGCRHLTDQGVKMLVENNRNLLALDVTQVHELSDVSIEALASNCHRLQGLNVTGCGNITDDSLVKLAENCKYIKRLKLNKCTTVTDVAIEAFAQQCPQLLEIDLYGCEQVTDHSVATLMRCLMQPKGFLRELRLASCSLLTDNCFASLPTDLRCDTLRIMDLTACPLLTDYAVERIVEAAPRLRILVLAKCLELTDRAVYSITKLGKNLHDIHLGRCQRITDNAVKELIKHCQRIRYIDLAGCSAITDESVTQLASLPKLRRIGLVKCQLVTDKSIRALAGVVEPGQEQQQPPQHSRHAARMAVSLERVHLSYCIKIKVEGITHLLNACPKLTHLSLTGIEVFHEREDILQFCREAPAEFNIEQRRVFCVFSGDGVSKLRDWLNEHPTESPITENGAEPGQNISGLLQNSALNDNDIDFDE